MADDRLSVPDSPVVLQEAVWRWGQRALAAGLAGGIVLSLLAAWRAPEVALLLPVALLGLVAATVLFRHPVLNLVVVLGGFVAVVNSDPGVQLSELIYGVYYYAFVFHWYGVRFLTGTRIVRTWLDRALALFIVGGGGLGVAMGFLLGAELGAIRADFTAFSMLALYFPVKELCRTHRRGPEIVMASLLWIGLFLSVNTFRLFRGVVQSATLAWQIADVRFGAVETLILVSCFTLLVLLLLAHRWWERFGLLGLLTLGLGALVLTRGRTFWIAFVLGAGLFLVLLRGRQRLRLATLIGGGTLALVAVALVFFGQFAELILSGTLNRIATIEGAASQDVSLIARFIEAEAIGRDYLSRNPILGHGFGTMFRFYDIIEVGTVNRTFSHNGYIAVWFKLGIFGLLTLLLCWGRALLDAYLTYRDGRLPERHRAFALIALVSLTVVSLTANTAIFFLTIDQMFAFALLVALVSGLAQRYERGSGWASETRRLPTTAA